MDQLKKLKGLCDKANIVVEIIKPPKYILPFNDDHASDIVLVRKEGNLHLPFTPIISIKKEGEEEFDLTGSPLYTSLDDSLINQPFSQLQANENEYYNHVPLTYSEAMQVINGYSTSGNSTFFEKELPVWILCNAADVGNTVLMFIWRESTGWASRGKASLVSPIACNQDGFPSLEAMLKIHLQAIAVTKADVSYMVKACYIHDRGTLTGEFDELSGNDTVLRMQFSWKRPYVYFHVPPVDASSTLEMTVAVGYEGALLWQEIETLRDINCLMDECAEERETCLLASVTSTNITMLGSSLRGRIHSYICTGNFPEASDHSVLSRMQQNGILHIHQAYSDAVEGRRSSSDMTEVLWTILKGCSEIAELNSCFKLLLREAAARRFEPMILPDNKTTLARLIQGFRTGNTLKTMPPRLQGNDCLRLLFELGYLKIQRDYKYIFHRIELNALHLDQINEKLEGFHNLKSEERKKCIENLVNIHSLLEVLMLLKARLHLDEDSLAAIVTPATSTLLSSRNVFARNIPDDSISTELNLQRTVCISIPIHSKLMIPLVKGSIPITWSVCLSTLKEKQKVQTIFHNSNELFPSGIVDQGDQTINQSCENSENSVIQFNLLSDKFLPKH